VFVVAKEQAACDPWPVAEDESKLEDPGSKESVLLNPRFSNLDSPSSDPWPAAAVYRLTAIASDALTAAENSHDHEVAYPATELRERETELVGLNLQFVILNSIVTSLETVARVATVAAAASLAPAVRRVDSAWLT